ncbi:MAG: AsmA-like C-terminal region-containing protein [Gammaproteobacteria bacterium]|nr:AsmA-like C-terminal region-containing protein [Gammaproteobacteria bacterium]
MKEPIEDRLSQMSGLEVSINRVALEFHDNELVLAVHDVDVGAKGLDPIASIDVLRWNADLIALYKNTEIPGRIDINELTLNNASIEKYIANLNTESVFSSSSLSGLMALEMLSVKKTIINGEKIHQLAPIELVRDEQKITLSMDNQAVYSGAVIPEIGNTVNIKTSIDVARAKADRLAIIPFTIKNDDFTLSAQLRIFSQQDKVYLEFQSYIDSLDVAKIHQNIPKTLAKTKSASWLDRALVEGTLSDIMLATRFSIGGQSEEPITKFSANLENAKFSVDPAWEAITELDAKITLTNDYVQLVGENAKIDALNVDYINLSAENFDKPNAKIKGSAHITSTSEEITNFLEKSPISDKLKNFISRFELSGALRANVDISAPFERKGNEGVEVDFDAYVKDNVLSIPELNTYVEKYNSMISYHNKILKTKGRGQIANKEFELSLNPDEWISKKDSPFRVSMSLVDTSINAYISRQTSSKWHAQIESDNLQAGVNLLIEKDDIPVIELENLVVETIDGNLGSWGLSPQDFPSFHLSSNGTEINGKSVPDLEADLINKGDIMEIKNLTLKDIGLSKKDLVFNGNWLEGRTVLRAKASHSNLSDFLIKLGIEKSVSGGAFSTDLRLYCECQPWEVTIPKISGFLSTEIEEGIVTNEDPTFFKLLSYINLATIADRLRKPRSELRKQGFVYDRIGVDLIIENGKASISNFDLESEESGVRMSGYADLIDRTYNLQAIVTPSIADTIPLATYLAGGGLAGLGVWAADKLLFGGEIIGSFFDEVIELTYEITGPWLEPNIVRLPGVTVL